MKRFQGYLGPTPKEVGRANFSVWFLVIFGTLGSLTYFFGVEPELIFEQPTDQARNLFRYITFYSVLLRLAERPGIAIDNWYNLRDSWRFAGPFIFIVLTLRKAMIDSAIAEYKERREG